MLVRNQFTNDTRVIKEARALIHEGHDVEVIALGGDGLKDYEIRDDNIKVRRIHARKKVAKIKIGWADRVRKFAMKLPSKSILLFYKHLKFNAWFKIIWVLFLPIIIVFVSIQVLIYFIKSNKIFVKLIRIFNNNPSKIDNAFVKAGIDSCADIIHAHDLNTLLPAVLVCDKTGAKLIYDSHELFVDRNTQEGAVQKIKWNLIEPLYIKKATKVITVSDSIAETLAERYQIEKPVVIRNVQEYKDYEKTDDLRKHQKLMKLPDSCCIAIYAGRITFGRGIENLVEASQYLKDNAIILLMGGGNLAYRKGIEDLIRNQSLPNKIFLIPPVKPDEVHKYLCGADIGLMPTENICLSYYYGAGNKLFHYLMAGLPTLVSDHPEKRKIIEKYEVGQYVNEESPMDIASAIQELADDIELRKRISNNAKLAAKQLNWENETKKLMELYRSL